MATKWSPVIQPTDRHPVCRSLPNLFRNATPAQDSKKRMVGFFSCTIGKLHSQQDCQVGKGMTHSDVKVNCNQQLMTKNYWMALKDVRWLILLANDNVLLLSFFLAFSIFLRKREILILHQLSCSQLTLPLPTMSWAIKSDGGSRFSFLKSMAHFIEMQSFLCTRCWRWTVPCGVCWQTLL